MNKRPVQSRRIQSIMTADEKTKNDEIQKLQDENSGLKSDLVEAQNEVRRLRAASQRITETASLLLRYEQGFIYFFKIYY